MMNKSEKKKQSLKQQSKMEEAIGSLAISNKRSVIDFFPSLFVKQTFYDSSSSAILRSLAFACIFCGSESLALLAGSCAPIA